MTKPKYSIAGYRNRLRTTSRPTLLVEGKDDKAAFRYLLDELQVPGHAVWIDTADVIQGPPGTSYGNRELVEFTCTGIANTELETRLLGFVDREFRDFDLEVGVDWVNGHKVDGRLVWSRGHSIETYLLDVMVLRDAFRSIGISANFAHALGTLEAVFHSVLKIACAISLTVHETQMTRLVSGSLAWQVMKLVSGEMVLDTAEWKRRLLVKLRCTDDMASRLVESYDRWAEQVKGFDPSVARWMCHGHLGLAVVWSAFARILYEESGNADEAELPYRANADVRYSASLNSWARQVREGLTWPDAAFSLLGLLE